MSELRVLAPDGVAEVGEGDDLASVLLDVVDLEDGDVVLVTSKVVSKSEGRVRPGTREDALPGETARVVARRGQTAIVRTHHGLTLAAAGIDASNVESGHVVLLPEDPDASARALRSQIRERTGANVAVLVTDTAGRAWREGQTDMAVGAAGLRVLESFVGQVDGHGNELAVTAPAVADELASAAELAQGKLGGRPFAVVRGRPDLVLPPGDDGSGAVALVRAEGADMFGYGAREAVLAAVTGDASGLGPFGAPCSAPELLAVLAETLPEVDVVAAGPALDLRGAEGPIALARAVCHAHGWVADAGAGRTEARVRPSTP